MRPALTVNRLATSLVQLAAASDSAMRRSRRFSESSQSLKSSRTRAVSA
jgi:hypothetical protein